MDAARRVPLVVETGERQLLLEDQRDLLVQLARLDPAAVTLAPELGRAPDQAVALPVGSGVTGYLPLAGLFDVEAERKRLTAEAEHERRGVDRSRTLLNNQSYLAKAPADVVERERARLAEAEARLAAIEQRLRRLG